MKQALFLTIFLFGFIAAITGVAFLMQGPSTSLGVNKSGAVLSSQTNSSLSAQHNEFDFGTVKMSEGNVYHTFKLKNDGSQDLTISKIATSCDCTSAQIIKKDGRRSQKFGMEGMGGNNLLSETIKPGEDFELEVEFNPATHGPAGVGFVKRVVYLETNSKTKPRLELVITANVVI